MESISFGRYLMYENDKSKILEAIYILDAQMKELHLNNMYLPIINAENILYNADNTFSFKNISKIPYDKNECVKSNIIKFSHFSLGVYASLAVDKTSFADYTKLNNDFIYQNYPILREMIPYGKEYYDNIVVDQNYSYYSDFLDSKAKNEASSSLSNKLVKATAAGKVYSDEKAGFSDIAFYPVMCTIFIIFAIICYFVITGFRG